MLFCEGLAIANNRNMEIIVLVTHMRATLEDLSQVSLASARLTVRRVTTACEVAPTSGRKNMALRFCCSVNGAKYWLPLLAWTVTRDPHHIFSAAWR